PSTIIGGVVELWQIGSYPVATVIFVASILVPVGKLLALGWLCIAAKRSAGYHPAIRTRLYRLTEFIGRWSMVDIFVVAILAALIRGGALMSVSPGPAALPFAGVVVLTMLAAFTFDPRLLWEASSPAKEAHHV
ncbi:MAG TPA: paraquat-inducible protein A, partial [Modicisalibacter sp.]|nr:paraquat-inducible protein A [Modicisalibacter sp.]